MPSTSESSATVPILVDVDQPNFKVRYIKGKKVRITWKNGDVKTWPLIPKPTNASKCKLEQQMECGEGFLEPHGTCLDIQAKTRRDKDTITNGRPVLFADPNDLDRHNILMSVQSACPYLYRFPGNWAGREMLRHSCRNKRDTVANKQGRLKGGRGKHRGENAQGAEEVAEEAEEEAVASGEEVGAEEVQDIDEQPTEEGDEVDNEWDDNRDNNRDDRQGNDDDDDEPVADNHTQDGDKEVVQVQKLDKGKGKATESEGEDEGEDWVGQGEDEDEDEDDDGGKGDQSNPPANESDSQSDSDSEDVPQPSSMSAPINPKTLKVTPKSTVPRHPIPKPPAPKPPARKTTSSIAPKPPAPKTPVSKTITGSKTAGNMTTTKAPPAKSKSSKAVDAKTPAKAAPAKSTTPKGKASTPTAPPPSKPPRPTSNLKLVTPSTQPPSNPLTLASSSKRRAEGPPAGQSAPTPKKRKALQGMDRNDSWGNEFDQELQELRTAAVASQGKKRKPAADKHSPTNDPLPTPETTSTTKRLKRPNMRPAPPPEESALAVGRPSTSQPPVPPVTTLAAKAELVDEVEMQNGGRSKAPMVRRSNRNKKPANT